MSETAAKQHKWTIIAADQAGDTVELTENEHAHLEQLLRLGVRELIGPHANPDEYDLLIGGTIQEDLHRTLVEAGLHDGSEVVILPTDVSRG
jgi:hypothetical protein